MRIDAARGSGFYVGFFYGYKESDRAIEISCRMTTATKNRTESSKCVVASQMGVRQFLGINNASRFSSNVNFGRTGLLYPNGVYSSLQTRIAGPIPAKTRAMEGANGSAVSKGLVSSSRLPRIPRHRHCTLFGTSSIRPRLYHVVHPDVRRCTSSCYLVGFVYVVLCHLRLLFQFLSRSRLARRLQHRSKAFERNYHGRCNHQKCDKSDSTPADLPRCISRCSMCMHAYYYNMWQLSHIGVYVSMCHFR